MTYDSYTTYVGGVSSSPSTTHLCLFKHRAQSELRPYRVASRFLLSWRRSSALARQQEPVSWQRIGPSGPGEMTD